MKIYTNKKYNTIAFYVLLIVAISLLMVVTLFKLDKILHILGNIISVLMPIIWGIAIAYILNPVMKFFEKSINKWIFKKKEHKKACRTLSVILTTIVTLAFLTLLICIIAPKIKDSIASIINIDNITNNIAKLQNWTNNFIDDNPELKSYINNEFESISTYLTNLVTKLQPSFDTFTSNFTKGMIHFLLGIKDFILGIIVSIYLLLSKETLLAQIKKILLALFKKRTCKKLFDLFHKSNKMFNGFISGKIVDSFIIGILCFIGLKFLSFENAVLISVIIGVTNIIPFFGPFIGAIPSGLLVLFDDPKKIILFLIFILVLQQFDGNILGPRILDNSTGLPAFWVLFAIFLGGGLFGFVGMLLGVPTFAVIYSLVRTYIETRLERNNLPKETKAYENDIEKLYTVKRAKNMEKDNIDFEEFLQDKKT